MNSSPSPSFAPTDEQLAIRESATTQSTSLIITAYAGCAKTTTLELTAAALPQVPSLALAFNTRIKKELTSRFPKYFEIKTLNGLGHTAWGRALGRGLTLDDRKLGKLTTEAAAEAKLELNADQWTEIRSLATRAMQRGLIPDTFPQRGLVPDDSDTWEALADELWLDGNIPRKCGLARQVLVSSIKLGLQGTISFDDQIYLSSLFGGVFPRFPLVMVDESQDLSPLNHLMVRRASAGRIIAVGDPKQAIYQFRGADSASMVNLRKVRPEWLDLPLATTFRCPSLIVQRQQDHAPGFRAWHTNQSGAILEYPQDKPWTWTSEIQPLLDTIGPSPSMAILCRNNAPLVAMAFKLIRQGIGVVMLGRDIGKGLEALASKIITDPTASAQVCSRLVSGWIEQQSGLAVAAGKPQKLAGITDRGECLLAVLESVRDGAELRSALRDLFSRETGRVTLSSGHRSKGFEWDLVLHLDSQLIPSRFALKAAAQGDPSQLEQERNLSYVIETRTKHTLVLAHSADFS